MAARRKSNGSSRGKARGGRKSGGASRARKPSGSDAIALLKSDHREVKGWFEQFKKARNEDRQAELAEKICMALKAHTTIEEEIFYPAFLDATEDTSMHHEAEVEHDGAKKLIAEIESNGSGDEYFKARITVLEEMIRHHVNEEEQRNGMFAKARASSMDLKELGRELQARKKQLLSELRPATGFLESIRTATLS
ncbi:MAG TPA: hemerythrin domain-containing protein [Steroidobacteraceae bacterium]|jgi:hypothetical protein